MDYRIIIIIVNIIKISFGLNRCRLIPGGLTYYAGDGNWNRASPIEYCTCDGDEPFSFSIIDQKTQMVYIDRCYINEVSPTTGECPSEIALLVIKRSIIKSLESNLFNRHNETLINIHMFHNIINNISRDAFNGLGNLKLLDLENCSVNTIENDFLKGVNSLQSLKLIENNISNISLDFENCQLRDLYLRKNKIEEIPDISNCSNLQFLDISENRIQNLPIDAIQGMNLKFLDISHNNITNISSVHLEIFKKIIDLNVNNNPFLFESVDFPQSLFNKPSFLLNLENVGIKTIQNDTFSGNEYTRSLNLNGNKLRYLPDNIFNGLGLYYLNISNNQLLNISKSSFSGLTQLDRLDLSSNKLKHLPDDVFSNLVTLYFLKLSNNALQNIQSSRLFSGLKNLNYLDLSYNNLDYLANDIFRTLTYLKELYLQNNRLTSIRQEDLPNKLLRLDINENQIDCVKVHKLMIEMKDVLVNGTSYDTSNIRGIKCIWNSPKTES